MSQPISGLTRTTLSREAYWRLRSAILSGQLEPGSKLIVRILAEQLALSPTPIKEALSALEREGLVQAIPHRGYRVPKVTAEDVGQIYRLREVLEGLSARLAAERTGPALAARLEVILAAMRVEVDSESPRPDTYGDLDIAFHRALWEASAHPRLQQIAETSAGLIRMLIPTSALLPERGLLQSFLEHQNIAQAVAAGNGERAESEMREHVRRARVALENSSLRAGPLPLQPR